MSAGILRGLAPIQLRLSFEPVRPSREGHTKSGSAVV